jgi:hypothetical protein
MGGMRRLLAMLAVGASIAGTYEAEVAAPAAPDPGKRLAAALLTAASRHDAKALWALLSTPSRRRLGPTFAEFEKAGAAQIERALTPFRPSAVQLVVHRTVSDRFGVVAMRRGMRAVAFPIRREGRAWKVETPGPIRLRVLGPAPSSHGRVAQVAFEATAPAAVEDAIIFVDGKLYPPYLVPAGRKATVYVTLRRALKRGAHTAVGYAEQGSNVGALAWSFTAA